MERDVKREMERQMKKRDETMPQTSDMQDFLQRFVTAQEPVMHQVHAELAAGHKQSHWMWFVFPQIAGLGRSDTSRYYALPSLSAARAYLAHPVLGPRLRDCCALVLSHTGSSAQALFGATDTQKLRSSMTLFQLAAPECPIFGRILTAFFRGKADPLTLEILSSD